MPTPPPGWYADPAGSARYRWWDGRTWTDALSGSPHARPPLDAVAAGPVTVDPSSADQERAPAPASEVASTSSTEILEAGPRDRHRAIRPLAVVVVLALVCVAALGLGTALLGSDRGTRTGSGTSTGAPPPTGPASTTAPRTATRNPPPPGWVNQVTGAAQIGDASMSLPGDPYQVSADAYQSPVFDAAFFANAPVHVAYRGSDSWFATVALVHVPADQVAADPEATGKKAVAATLRWFFGSTEVEVKNEQLATLTIDHDRPAVRVSAEVWYDIDGLASTHDDLTFVIAALADGSYVAAVSSVPNDAPAEQRTLAATSVASLTMR